MDRGRTRPGPTGLAAGGAGSDVPTGQGHGAATECECLCQPVPACATGTAKRRARSLAGHQPGGMRPIFVRASQPRHTAPPRAASRTVSTRRGEHVSALCTSAPHGPAGCDIMGRNPCAIGPPRPVKAASCRLHRTATWRPQAGRASPPLAWSINIGASRKKEAGGNGGGLPVWLLLHAPPGLIMRKKRCARRPLGAGMGNGHVVGSDASRARARRSRQGHRSSAAGREPDWPPIDAWLEPCLELRGGRARPESIGLPPAGDTYPRTRPAWGRRAWCHGGALPGVVWT